MNALIPGRASPRRISPRPPQAFSLVELLIVIAVIVILLALLLPAIGMARATARAKKCASNEAQVWHGWTRANSRDPSHPVKGSQWNTRVASYLEGGTDVFYCPDDTTHSLSSSYAFNAHAWRFAAQDVGRIVLLDYKAMEIPVVGQTIAQLGAWDTLHAPRHFQKMNVTFYDGHVDAFDANKIDPRFCDYYIRYWRPYAESHKNLTGCVSSGDTPPTLPPPPGTTTTGGTTGAGATTGGTTTTTTGGTTTGPTTADMSIIKADSVDPVLESTQLTYTITVTNNGPGLATAVTVLDSFPSGVSYVSSTLSQGNAVVVNNTMTATLGDIAAGGNATISVVVDVLAGTGGAQISNTATVTASTTDPVSSNNSSTQTTFVNPNTNPCTPPTPSQDAAKGLDWLIRHQNDDGSWSFNHSAHPGCAGACPNIGSIGDGRIGATGLALLPLLGAGHIPGTNAAYADNVCRALQFLVASQDPATGSFQATGDKWMYQQLIASLALTEATILKADAQTASCPAGTIPCTLTADQLRQAGQLAVNYACFCQLVSTHSPPGKGGWMYQPDYYNSEGGGDMSHHGWGLKVLKSAQLAGLTVPAANLTEADNFLTIMQTNPVFDNFYNSTLGDYKYYGGTYSPYNSAQKTTTAIGLLCKVFRGAPPQHVKIQSFTSGKVPVRGAVHANFYLTHLLYATGGSNWNNWKNLMQQHLQNEQAVGGHVDGSWFWGSADEDNVGGAAGGWGHAGWNSAGGRLFCTAISLLCLEQNFSRLKLGGSFGGGTGGNSVQVVAGPDQSITQPTSSATLNGSSWGGVGSRTSTWSMLSGPGTVTFGNANAEQTTASFSAIGTYTLRLTVTDGSTTATDDVLINYTASDKAQFVRVRLNLANYLCLAEVRVIDDTGVNRAVTGTASQITTAFSSPASRAIDNNTNANWGAGSVTHTTNTANAWWMVNLGAKYKINQIVVYNRSDSGCNWSEGASVQTYELDPIANPTQPALWTGAITGTSCGSVHTFNLP